MNDTQQDAWDSAENATWNQTSTYFGQVKVDVWHCALVKGEGKVPFDPNLHGPDRRRTAIDFQIFPISQRMDFVIKRELIAESKEWVQITKPSLTALGTDLRGIKDRYVQVELVPNGTYTDKNGEEKTRTAVKFVKVFADAAECQQAADAFFGSSSLTSTTAAGAAPSGSASNGSTTGTANSPDPQRAVLAKFLGPLYAACGKDPHKFAEKLLADATLSKHFSLTSPEVLAVVGG